MPIQKITSGIIESSQTLTTPTISGNLSLDSTGTTGVRVPSANTLAFHTAGTEDMRIDSSGNVGVGVTSLSDKLTIAHADEKGITFKATGTDGTTAAQLFFEDTNGGTGGVFRFDHDVNSFTFATAGTTERMRIDSSGRVTMPYQPAFRAGRLSNVSVADQGVVVFDSATTNIGSNYNTSTGRFTAPIAGMYQFNMQVLFTGLSNGNQCEMQFRVNGSDNMAFGPRVKYQADYTGWNEYVSMIGTTSVYLNANDYVQVINISGGTRSIYGSNPAVWSVFSGFLIG